MAYPQDLNISTIFTQTLETDKPYVDLCIAGINAEIVNRVDNDLEFQFSYDLEPHIGELTRQQQSRIKDNLVYHYRNLGIRCGLSSMYVYAEVNQNPDFVYDSLPQEAPDPEFLIMRFAWFIRLAREYMKTYV